MKKTVKSIMASILCVVILLSLAACGGSDVGNSPTDTGTGTTSNSSTNNSNSLVKSDEPIYLSDMLEADGTRIWYKIGDNSIGKDARISQVFVFENGEATVYIPDTSSDSALRTLGDASKLTDEEILEILMQVYLQKDQTLYDGFFAEYDASENNEEIVYNLLIKLLNEGYNSGNLDLFGELFYGALEQLLTSGAIDDATFGSAVDELMDLIQNGAERAEIEAFCRRFAQQITADANEVATYEAMLERAAPPSVVYERNIITDNTGNNTKSEKIIYSYVNYNSPITFARAEIVNFLTGENIELLTFCMSDELYTTKETKLHLIGGYGEGQVYDSLYGGFVLDGKEDRFITRLSETLIDTAPTNNTTPRLDTPQHPGVTVD